MYCVYVHFLYISTCVIIVGYYKRFCVYNIKILNFSSVKPDLCLPSCCAVNF